LRKEEAFGVPGRDEVIQKITALFYLRYKGGKDTV
jgi:hypothetical protein